MRSSPRPAPRATTAAPAPRPASRRDCSWPAVRAWSGCRWRPWLRGCRALNAVRLHLTPGDEAMGWDLLALGLPAAGEPFDSGRFTQHLEVPGVWLERALIAAEDHRLLDSPLGLGGHRVLATMWWIGGEALAPARRQALLDSARDVLASNPLRRTAGATPRSHAWWSVRLLAAGVEPALQCLMAVRAACGGWPGAWRPSRRGSGARSRCRPPRRSAGRGGAASLASPYVRALLRPCPGALLDRSDPRFLFMSERHREALAHLLYGVGAAAVSCCSPARSGPARPRCADASWSRSRRIAPWPTSSTPGSRCPSCCSRSATSSASPCRPRRRAPSASRVPLTR